jgi:hypothetical protein
LILAFLSLGCPSLIDSVSIKELGSGYVYDEINLPAIYRDTPSHKFIPAIVKSYSYDSRFIIVKQVSHKICNERLGKDYTYDDCQTLLKNMGTEPNYWIISHKEDSIYGPHSFNEYLNLRKKLGVPEKLSLGTRFLLCGIGAHSRHVDRFIQHEMK